MESWPRLVVTWLFVTCIDSNYMCFFKVVFYLNKILMLHSYSETLSTTCDLYQKLIGGKLQYISLNKKQKFFWKHVIEAFLLLRYYNIIYTFNYVTQLIVLLTFLFFVQIMVKPKFESIRKRNVKVELSYQEIF